MKKQQSDQHHASLSILNPEVLRIGIISSSFYEEEIATMVESAHARLLEHGILPGNIGHYPVPGSFEIPLIGAALVKQRKVDALIALGIIVEGETHHARLIAEQTVRGIMDIQITFNIPFACEVLYVDSLELACDRLHKGAEAATGVLLSLAQLRRLQS